MTFQTIDALKLNRLDEQSKSEEHKKAKRSSREAMDRAAEDNRMKWKDVLKIADKLFGKHEGLSITESKKVIEEIKRGSKK